MRWKLRNCISMQQMAPLAAGPRVRRQPVCSSPRLSLSQRADPRHQRSGICTIDACTSVYHFPCPPRRAHGNHFLFYPPFYFFLQLKHRNLCALQLADNASEHDTKYLRESLSERMAWERRSLSTIAVIVIHYSCQKLLIDTRIE